MNLYHHENFKSHNWDEAYMKLNIVFNQLALLLYVHEFPDTVLDPDADFSDGGFCWFCSFSP